MRNKKDREKWGTPRLIIMTRGRAEEAVLIVCKGNGVDITPLGTHTSCSDTPVCGADCNSLSLS